jgi:hypothetical protein
MVLLGKMNIHTEYNPCLSPYTKQLKIDQNLNMRPETLKLVEKTIVEVLQNIGRSNDFLNTIPTAQEIMVRTEEL